MVGAGLRGPLATPDLVASELLERLPPHEAVEVGTVPIGRHRRTVPVAVVDPRDPAVLRELHTRFPDDAVELVITNAPALEAAATSHDNTGLSDELADEEALDRTNQLRAVEAELVSTGGWPRSPMCSSSRPW